MDVAAGMNMSMGIQGAIQVLSVLQLWSSFWPQPASVEDDSTYDFIIVGAGTAGCKIAHGLVQNKDVSVLLIEAGGFPNIDSLFAGLMSFLPNSQKDWNYTTENDGFASQSLKNGVIQFAQGKLLGGSSAVDHFAYIRGHPVDYDHWAALANDSSWNFDGLYKYFIADEKLEDPEILKSSFKNVHGTNGYIKLKREPYNEIINPYLNSFNEIGYDTILDLNGIDKTVGFSIPLLTNDFFRQSNAMAYITPIKDYPNLHLMLDSLVTKIIFNGNVATGVKILSKDNKTLTIKARREVIITAGVFNSAKLLMLSGIGPEEHLKYHGIDVIADLPVGQNLQDHVSTTLIHTMDESESPQPPFDPTKFPAPGFIGNAALDKSQNCPEYQAIGLVFPHDSPGLVPFCSNSLGFSDGVCEELVKANKNRTILWSLIQQLQPKSRGSVFLRSSEPLDKPWVIAGSFSEISDLDNQITFVEDYRQIENTSYFKNVGAKLVDLKLPQCSQFKFGTKAYLECYIVNMAGTIFHFIGTCALGSVVDARLRVNGVSNLRVADSSAIPRLISGNVKAAVNVLAGKAVDMIKTDNNLF